MSPDEAAQSFLEAEVNLKQATEALAEAQKQPLERFTSARAQYQGSLATMIDVFGCGEPLTIAQVKLIALAVAGKPVQPGSSDENPFADIDDLESILS